MPDGTAELISESGAYRGDGFEPEKVRNEVGLQGVWRFEAVVSRLLGLQPPEHRGLCHTVRGAELPDLPRNRYRLGKCRACGCTGRKPPEILSDELTQQFREMFARVGATSRYSWKGQRVDSVNL